jgi:hypothetical protein
MRFTNKILPGRPGSKKLMREYGDRLICVRYRYDSETGEKIKTVEILIDKQAWAPKSSAPPPNKRVALRIGFGEKYLRMLVKCAGGKWDPDRQVWMVPLSEVRSLGLEKRIIEKHD